MWGEGGYAGKKEAVKETKPEVVPTVQNPVAATAPPQPVKKEKPKKEEPKKEEVNALFAGIVKKKKGSDSDSDDDSGNSSDDEATPGQPTDLIETEKQPSIDDLMDTGPAVSFDPLDAKAAPTDDTDKLMMGGGSSGVDDLAGIFDSTPSQPVAQPPVAQSPVDSLGGIFDSTPVQAEPEPTLLEQKPPEQ